MRPETCSRTVHLRRMLRNGRVVAAKQQAAAWLREGYASKPFLALIADLVDPSRRGGDRKPRRPPLQWQVIGEAFETLRRDGFTHQQSVLILVTRFRRSASFIQKTLDYYRTAQPDGSDVTQQKPEDGLQSHKRDAQDPVSHPPSHNNENYNARR